MAGGRSGGAIHTQPGRRRGALKKIGGLYKQGRLDTPNAETASICILPTRPSNRCSIFNPRTRRWPTVLAIDRPLTASSQGQVIAANQYERDQVYEQTVAGHVRDRNPPETLTADIGRLTADHIKAAAAIRFNLPPEVNQALREPAGAASVVYSLVLSEDDAVRARQMEILRANGMSERTAALASPIQALSVKYKLGAGRVCRAGPAPAQPGRIHAFDQTVQRLVECDGASRTLRNSLNEMIAPS